MTSKLPKILAVVFIVVVAALIGIQLYIAFNNPYTVETVFSYQVDESFGVEGIVLRDEMPLNEVKSGAVDYLIRNGDKVSKDAVVAQMYPSETDIANMAKAERLEAELRTVKESQDQGAAAGTQATALARQINVINQDYVASMQNHSLDSLYELKNGYLGAYNRSQIVFSDAGDFNARIENLQQRIDKLRRESGESVSSVSSPASGYFVNALDGYEETFSLEEADSLTEAQIHAYIHKKKAEPDSRIVGKVITNPKWRYIAVVSTADAALLTVGRKYDLLFNSASDETVSAVVISNSFDASEKSAIVVFETDIFSGKLVKLRFEEAQVVLKAHEGIRIPKTAIRMKDGEKGVYVRYGQSMRFKLVDIIYENEEFLLSASKEEDLDRSKYVRVYDDVIVKGSDLYEGKQLS